MIPMLKEELKEEELQFGPSVSRVQEGPNMDRGPIMDTFYSRQQMRPFRSKFDNETLRNAILAQFYVRNRSSIFFCGTYNACMESIDTKVFENRSKSLGKTRYVLC